MLNLLCIFVVLLATCPALSEEPYGFVATLLREAGIIPDVIATEPPFDPQAFLFVTLPVGPALLGNTVNATNNTIPPNVTFTPMQALADKLYTIVMVDLDAPTRDNHTYAGYRHWLATGVKPPKNSCNLAEFTQPVTTPYLSPNPPVGTGAHRYTFLLYREPRNNFVIPAGAIEYGRDFNSRENWNATAFAEEYGLHLVAANFFYVDDREQ